MQRFLLTTLWFLAAQVVLAQNTVVLKLADPCFQTETSIQEFHHPEKSFGLKIFPNPSREKVTFDITSAENIGIIEVQFINMHGAIVWRERLFSANSTLRKTLDIHTYPAGVYAVSVSRKGERVSKILVIK
jgi:hypothetical protein